MEMHRLESGLNSSRTITGVFFYITFEFALKKQTKKKTSGFGPFAFTAQTKTEYAWKQTENMFSNCLGSAISSVQVLDCQISRLICTAPFSKKHQPWSCVSTTEEQQHAQQPEQRKIFTLSSIIRNEF